MVGVGLGLGQWTCLKLSRLRCANGGQQHRAAFKGLPAEIPADTSGVCLLNPPVSLRLLRGCPVVLVRSELVRASQVGRGKLGW